MYHRRQIATLSGDLPSGFSVSEWAEGNGPRSYAAVGSAASGVSSASGALLSFLELRVARLTGTESGGSSFVAHTA